MTSWLGWKKEKRRREWFESLKQSELESWWSWIDILRETIRALLWAELWVPEPETETRRERLYGSGCYQNLMLKMACIFHIWVVSKASSMLLKQNKYYNGFGYTRCLWRGGRYDDDGSSKNAWKLVRKSRACRAAGRQQGTTKERSDDDGVS